MNYKIMDTEKYKLNEYTDISLLVYFCRAQ